MKNYAWVKVRMIREEEIPIELPDDLPFERRADYVERSIAARPPDKRLSAAAKLRWEYEAQGGVR